MVARLRAFMTEVVTSSTGDADKASKLVRRGSFVALGGYAASQALRLGGNLVLWKILEPRAFGMVAIVNVLLQGLQMFSDIGVGPSIVQNPRGNEPTFLNTAWTIQVGRGVVLWLVATALSVPVAHFYAEPMLASLLPVAALAALFAGLNSTRLFSATRAIALGRLTLIDLGSQAVGLVVMISWAFFRPSVWALVAGGIVSAAVRMVMSHSLLPGIRNRPLWDRESAASLIRFGRWVFLSTLLAFAVMQSDRLIFGGMIPMDQLGVYSIAVTWATLPSLIVDKVMSSALFPALSRANDVGALRNVYEKTRKPWLLLGAFGSACLVAAGPQLIDVLYDARAVNAGWIIQLLATAGWFLILETANATVLLAKGRSDWVAAGSFAKLVGMIALIWTGHALYGFPGALAGFAGSELARYVVSTVAVVKERVSLVPHDGLLTLAFGAASGLGWLAANATRSALSPFLQVRALSAFVEATAAVAVAGVIFGVMYLRARRPR
jgi:O-antigen/teichoic acid export membrane protein